MAVDVKLKLQDDATRVFNQFVGNVQRQSASIESTMKTVGTAIGAAFSIAAIGSFMKSAADAEAGTTALRTALKNAGETSADAAQAFLDQADALKEKTAIDDDEIKKVQTLTIAMTGNAQAAYQLTPAILDLAAGMGISTDQAAKMFSKSLEGSEGLKKAGIVIGQTSSETERLGAIAEAVEKKWGGMSTAFASTDAGKMQSLRLALDDLQKSVGKLINNAILPALPSITRFINVFAVELPKYLTIASGTIARALQLVIAPFGLVQETFNKFGINTGHAFHNLFYDLDKIREDGLKAANSVDKTAESMGNLAGSTGKASAETKLMKDHIKALQDELSQLNPGTREYNDVLARLTREQFDYDDAVRSSNVAIHINTAALKTASTTIQTSTLPQLSNLKSYYKNLRLELIQYKEDSGIVTDQVTSDLTKQSDAAQATEQIMFSVYSSLGEGIKGIFANTDKTIGGVLKNVLNIVITTVEGLMVAAAAAAKAFGVITFGGSLAKDIPLLAAGFLLLEGARAFINKFHEGGTMGSDGNRIPFGSSLQSDERHAILKVGETVRTPQQEASLRSGSPTIFNLNFNHPVEGKEFIRSGLHRIARELGIDNLGQLQINQRSKIALTS